jgi:hypothetical protein
VKHVEESRRKQIEKPVWDLSLKVERRSAEEAFETT